jgi:hypothetical protein
MQVFDENGHLSDCPDGYPARKYEFVAVHVASKTTYDRSAYFFSYLALLACLNKWNGFGNDWHYYTRDYDKK